MLCPLAVGPSFLRLRASCCGSSRSWRSGRFNQARMRCHQVSISVFWWSEEVQQIRPFLKRSPAIRSFPHRQGREICHHYRTNRLGSRRSNISGPHARPYTVNHVFCLQSTHLRSLAFSRPAVGCSCGTVDRLLARRPWSLPKSFRAGSRQGAESCCQRP